MDNQVLPKPGKKFDKNKRHHSNNHSNNRNSNNRSRFNRKPRFNRANDSRDFNRPFTARGFEVRVDYRGDSEEEKTTALDKALSRLKKTLMKEGVIQQMKDRESFVSDSRKRYLKRKQLIYKRKVKELKHAKKFRRKK